MISSNSDDTDDTRYYKSAGIPSSMFFDTSASTIDPNHFDKDQYHRSDDNKVTSQRTISVYYMYAR